MTTDVEVVPFGALTARQLDGVRQIYIEAFPTHHRVPFEDLAGAGHVAIAARVACSPVGLAALAVLPSVEWTFLRYFAVITGLRGHGLGHRLWTAMTEHLACIGVPRRVVLEVEPPDEAEYGSAEWTVRQRRIRFYTRCGASVLAVHGYAVPPTDEGEQPQPMLLMAAAPAGAGRRARSRDELRALAVAIYVDHYGLTPDDPLIADLSI